MERSKLKRIVAELEGITYYEWEALKRAVDRAVDMEHSSIVVPGADPIESLAELEMDLLD